jgi:hypothetical protein
MRDDVLYGRFHPSSKWYQIQPGEPETETHDMLQTQDCAKKLVPHGVAVLGDPECNREVKEEFMCFSNLHDTLKRGS